MKASRLCIGLASALLMLGATTGAALADGTEIVDQDSFNFSGFASGGGGTFQFTSQSCSGTSISTVGEVGELAVDIEVLSSCKIHGQGQCFFGPSGPIWSGTIAIDEGAVPASDSYSGPFTVTWAGSSGTVSGTLTESEPTGPEGEAPGSLTGTISAPGVGDPCNNPGFPITGSLQTNA